MALKEDYVPKIIVNITPVCLRSGFQDDSDNNNNIQLCGNSNHWIWNDKFVRYWSTHNFFNLYCTVFKLYNVPNGVQFTYCPLNKYIISNS